MVLLRHYDLGETSVQREALLDHVLIQLEQHGLAATLPELLQGFAITESESNLFGLIKTR